MFTLYLTVSCAISHSFQVWSYSLVRMIMKAWEFAYIGMVAIYVLKVLSRRAKLGWSRVYYKLLIVSTKPIESVITLTMFFPGMNAWIFTGIFLLSINDKTSKSSNWGLNWSEDNSVIKDLLLSDSKSLFLGCPVKALQISAAALASPTPSPPRWGVAKNTSPQGEAFKHLYSGSILASTKACLTSRPPKEWATKSSGLWIS